MNTRSIVRKNNITADVETADDNPNMSDKAWKRTASHYKVTLKFGRRRLTTYFSMGSAHTNEPSVEDVLDSLASDAAGVDDSRDFEDWCSDYDFSTDSRSAERTYKACQKAAADLKHFMGDEYRRLLDAERM